MGEIRVLQVRPDPPSFFLTVMRGSSVLDESWAELQGLTACLTMAQRLQRTLTLVTNHTAPQRRRWFGWWRG